MPENPVTTGLHRLRQHLEHAHPRVLQLIMDSLRYWVLEMHVDGFRFDLASALARELHEVDRLGAFFDIIHQDPVLSQVKLIAEPWDLGEGGYQVGTFRWAGPNGTASTAIAVRAYWKGEGGRSASSPPSHRLQRPVRAWGGAPCEHQLHYLPRWLHPARSGQLRRKHNEANGEDNRDGENHNRSWNCGAEGPTDDAEINALRARQSRNLIATLLLSQGVPMLLAG
jgi:isoamylase